MIFYADTYSCRVHAIPCDAAGVPTGDTQKWRTVLTLDKEREGMPGEAACVTGGHHAVVSAYVAGPSQGVHKTAPAWCSHVHEDAG